MTEEQFRDFHTSARICAVCSLISALVVFPFYVHIDIVRNAHAGMSTGKYLDSGSIIFLQVCIFGNAVLLLAPAFVWARSAEEAWKRLLIPLFVSLIYPWLPLCILALVGTNPDGLWFRGELNSLVLLSLPLITWSLAWGVFWIGQKRKSL